nr:hypothetical protein CCACVL1_03418 [Ipomoea trifida]
MTHPVLQAPAGIGNEKLIPEMSDEPLLDPDFLADVAGEALDIIIGVAEDKLKRALVHVVGDPEGLRSAENMEIKLTVHTVVVEAISTAVAGITVEEATGVRGGGEESEGVLWMTRVGDELRELGAAEMEGEVARPTDVHLARGFL